MSNFDKNMEKIFDVAPAEGATNPPKPQAIAKPNAPSGLEEDLEDAYQQSRENLQGIIEQGHDAMEVMLDIAKAGQHPRSFEVYATLLKNMVDANKELLNIQKQMRDMDQKKEVTNTNIDKAIFVGSTADLGKLLKDNGNK
jgi:hypothetical protein